MFPALLEDHVAVPHKAPPGEVIQETVRGSEPGRGARMLCCNTIGMGCLGFEKRRRHHRCNLCNVCVFLKLLHLSCFFLTISTSCSLVPFGWFVSYRYSRLSQSCIRLSNLSSCCSLCSLCVCLCFLSQFCVSLHLA